MTGLGSPRPGPVESPLRESHLPPRWAPCMCYDRPITFQATTGLQKWRPGISTTTGTQPPSDVLSPPSTPHRAVPSLPVNLAASKHKVHREVLLARPRFYLVKATVPTWRRINAKLRWNAASCNLVESTPGQGAASRHVSYGNGKGAPRGHRGFGALSANRRHSPEMNTALLNPTRICCGTIPRFRQNSD